MDDSLLGVVLADQYRVDERIASGGMGDVYRAEDLRHHRTVAVKVLRRDASAGVTDERFRREVEIASGLSHPNLLPLYQSGRHGESVFFVMPYVEEETLERRFLREGPLSVVDAVGIAVELADGLRYAHERGVVHRDVKPANIFMRGTHPVLADFGIAKSADPGVAPDLTQAGTSPGTPLYMSPEQALEGQSDQRSDLYSLGCILYEMLTGDVPQRGATVLATFVKRQQEPPPSVRKARPDVSQELDRVVLRMLAPSPDARFASAAEAHTRLLACLDDARPGAANGGAAWRRPQLWAAGAAAVVLAAFAVVWSTSQDGDAIRTVAVLPFERQGIGVDDYLVDGLGHELRNQLSRVTGVSVASGESSDAAARGHDSLLDIAATLDVGGVVQGVVSGTADSLIVSLQLTDARTDRQAWGATWRGASEEIFTIQAAMLDSLVVALGLADRPGREDPRILRTTDIATHNLYLQGRYAAADRTQDALERARTLFDSAIARDPEYAPAWAALASAHALMGVYEYRSWRDLRPEAERAVAEAIRLDETVAEAHAARGVLLDYAFRWDEAQEAYERAIELNPSDAQAHHWYAVSRVLAGQPGEAAPLIERARSLDPLSFTIAVAAGWVYYYQRDLTTAVQRLEGALDLEPNAWVAYQYLGLAYSDQGRHAEGIEALERARDLNPSARSVLPGLARAQARAGHPETARRLLDEARVDGAPMSWLAIGYLAVGDRDEALSWLQRAGEAGPWHVIEINTFWFDELGRDPRFRTLVEAVHPE